MAVNMKTYPVDRLLAAFNLAMAAIWLMGSTRWDYAPILVGVHLAAAGLPWLIRTATLPAAPLVRLLRKVYPMIWLAAFWSEVDLLRRALHETPNDAVVLAAEEALLGGHLHLVWMPRMHELWISEIFYFSYFAYYLALVVPVLWLVIHASHDELMDALFRVMATFTACFLFYAFWPVDGPHFTGSIFDGPNGRGVFARLVDFVAIQHGQAMGAAFPSSHVAGAFTMAWVAWLYLPRWGFRILAVEAVGVFLSTVYTQQHYAIDALAGVVTALLVQTLMVPVVLRILRDRPQPIPGVPPLPVPELVPSLSREEHP